MSRRSLDFRDHMVVPDIKKLAFYTKSPFYTNCMDSTPFRKLGSHFLTYMNIEQVEKY
jgi:hypothetical protein